MTEQHRLSLRYKGEQIQEGMDPYVFAEAVRGFADLTYALHRNVYGDSSIELRVERIAEGSWLVDFLMSLNSQQISTISSSFADLVVLAKEVFSLIQHLGGKQPQSREVVGGGKVNIVNYNGNQTIYNLHAENIVLNQSGGKAAERFIRRPLMSEATALSVEFDGRSALDVDRTESESFVGLRSEEHLLESRGECWLTIIAPILEGDGRWKFSDGSRTIAARIIDENFMNAVHAGDEAFANGDNLRVVLLAIQEKIQGKIKTHFIIEKVISHERSQNNQQEFLL